MISPRASRPLQQAENLKFERIKEEKTNKQTKKPGDDKHNPHIVQCY